MATTRKTTEEDTSLDKTTKNLGGRAYSILAKVCIIIFCSELLVMMVLNWLGAFESFKLSLLDAILTTLLATFPLYFLLYRPVVKLAVDAAFAKQQFKSFLESTPCAIVVANTEGRIIFSNPQAERTFGYEPDKLNGQFIEVLVPDSLRASHSAKRHNYLSDPNPRPMGSGRLLEGRRRDGSLFPAEIGLSATTTDEGRIVIATVVDITERKRAEDSLRLSEERFRLLVEQAADAFFLHDIEGKFLDVNQRACESVGYTRDELLQMRVPDLEQDISPASLRNNWNRLQPGQFVTLSGSHRRKDGTHFPVEVRISRFDRGGEGFFLDLVRDITARQRAALELEERENDYRTILQTAMDGFWIVDMQGKILEVNEAYCDLSGYSRRELLTMRIPDLEALQNETEIRESIRSVIERGYSRFEVKHRRKDGGLMDVEISTQYLPNKQTFFVFLRDITERKRAENALRESGERLELAVGASNTGLWDWDLTTNKVHFSREWKSQIGYAEHEIGDAYEEWESRIHPDDLTATLSILRDYQANRLPEYKVEFRLRHKDGSYRWIIAHGATLKDSEGNPHRMLGSHADITERKAAEAKLREQEEGFRLLFEHNPLPMFVVDRDTTMFLEVNEAAIKNYGYSRNEFLEMKVPDIRPPEDRERLMEALRSIGPGDHPHAEWRHRLKNGRIIDVEVFSDVLDYRGRKAILASARDITERKRLESATRLQSEILRNIAEGIYLVGAGDMRIVYANPRMEEMFGYDPGEMNGKHVSIINAPAAGNPVQTAKEIETGLKETGEWRGEVLNVRKEGTPFWGHASISKYQHPELGEVYISVQRDISERKKLQEALLEREERFRSLVQNATVGIYRTTPDGRVVMANPALVKMLGYSTLQELQSRNLEYEGFSKNYPRQLFREQIEQEGQIRGLETTWIRRDGTVVFVGESARVVRDANGKVLYYDGVVEDITERKRSEALHELELTAIEQSADAIVITDTNGTIQYVNPAFTRITGYEREEALGQNPRILKSDHQDRTIYQNLWGTIKAGQVWVGDIVNRRKDGSIYTQTMTVAPVRDRRGAITNFVAIQRDITEYLRLQAQLLQVQKMEAVGRLAGGIAHDFNNMMNIILGYSQLLRKGMDPANPLFRMVEQIQKAGDQAASLVLQLLAFSRQQALDHKILDLNAVVAEAEEMIRRWIGEHIEVATDLDPALGYVKSSAVQLEQVIINLALNARDAMPHGGRLLISTSNVDIDESCPQVQRMIPCGAYVQLTVSDTGTGIDQETLGHIFEPFFTTKEEGKGTGLGLATAYGTITQSGGFIGAYSALGKGTTFEIYLPRIGTPVEISPAGQAEPAIAAGNETILLLEGEDSLRKLTRNFLACTGYSLMEASNSMEALEIVAKHKGSIHLLLTDVEIFGMNGFELANRLAESQPAMKILFFSGDTDTQVTGVGLKPGVAFLKKPLSKNRLIRKIRELLDVKTGKPTAIEY